MKSNVLKAIVFCVGIAILYSCLDPYNPSTTKADPSYLVVDGFLNATEKSCTITLSHTIPLSKESAGGPPPESKAQVKIEDDAGGTYILNEVSAGTYAVSALNLNVNNKYRLSVITSKHKEFVSEFVPIVQTPAIDSITFGNERLGVQIKINTHDGNSSTHYYNWKYSETWVYEAAYDSEIKFVNGEIVLRDESFFRCWRTLLSKSILISSSVKLREDLISNFPLTIIPWASAKLSIKYSIEAEQRGLTKDEYEYLLQQKKNTESLGSLFDPLPSRVIGNIQCVTDPDEPVIGYFGASTTQKKRVFIKRNDIKRPSGVPQIDRGYANCTLDTVLIAKGVSGELVSPLEVQGVLVGFLSTSTSCVDCRFAGGTTVKPGFWE